jgi:crotonobetainyl-CoA:carnitine CoA-transferase CaiB-like acyl-CoA transferase
LSSLWAGPLCAQLLGVCGAQVVKLESLQRPDGARRGSPAFFDLMNGGKRSVAVDIESESGLEQLRGLLARADIVIESSRPRALAQLGVDAEELVRSGLGKTWLSITGYGRGEPEAGWVAFGDDAAAAAGLTATAGCGTPVFCGDAIADPLTGLHAAVAALASWLTGGGRLLDVSLRNVAARATRLPAPDRASPTRPLPPRARDVTCRAASLGRDTRAVLAECEIHC